MCPRRKELKKRHLFVPRGTKVHAEIATACEAHVIIALIGGAAKRGGPDSGTSHAQVQGRQYLSRRFGLFKPVCHQQAQAIRRLPNRPEPGGDADADDPACIGFSRCDRFSHESYRRAQLAHQNVPGQLPQGAELSRRHARRGMIQCQTTLCQW